MVCGFGVVRAVWCEDGKTECTPQGCCIKGIVIRRWLSFVPLYVVKNLGRYRGGGPLLRRCSLLYVHRNNCGNDVPMPRILKLA